MAKQIKLMLDPGHDYAKYNQSPVWPAYYEGNQMWRLTMFQKTALEKRGFIVGVTKQYVNHAISVTERGRMAKGYDALISNHSNSCGTERVDRPEGIYQYDDNCGTIDEESKALAKLLAQTVENVMGTNDSAKIYSKLASGDRDGDGKRNDDYYGVLYGAHQVGVAALILEHSFHSNLRAAKWLMKDENLKRLAEAEADALACYYGMDTNAAPSPADILAEKGVINSPDYWETVQYQLTSLPTLLVKLAEATGTKNVADVKTAPAAIQRLADYKVIVSPDYWLANYGKVEYLDKLLISAANHVGTAAEDPNQMYRIRKSWSDAGSQIGAYRNLDNAKAACKAGYTVYDKNGTAVYSMKG